MIEGGFRTNDGKYQRGIQTENIPGFAGYCLPFGGSGGNGGS